jgi:Ni,Fe-hydrogenase III small subunit/ferredoxin
MAWVLRGLRNGVLTTPYPRRPDGYGPQYRSAVRVTGATADEGVEDLCPTGAIGTPGARLSLDRGRCVLCGRCVQARPESFAFEPEVELASLRRQDLVVAHPGPPGDDEGLDRLRRDLARRVRALRRSVHIRHVDAGSDGAEEWEVAALTNPVYDVQRLGIAFTASPRHADLLLVTGAGAAGMVEPLRRTYEAMPDPKIVVAAGTDAISGGIVHPSYATRGGVCDAVPVDVLVPGSPPSPFSLLHGILLGIGLLGERMPAPLPTRSRDRRAERAEGPCTP